MTHPIIPGAEPYSATGDARGALVLHGFTGNPQSMRGLALALADAGYTVEMPLLPGHGTDIADMVPTRWPHWCEAADDAFTALAARCDAVAVVGLSMGASLAVWLAEHHPEVAALSVVNPLVTPPDVATTGFIEAMIEGGDEIAPGIGSDIADGGLGRVRLPRAAPAGGAVPLRGCRGGRGQARLGDVPGVALHERARTMWSTPSRARCSWNG